VAWWLADTLTKLKKVGEEFQIQYYRDSDEGLIVRYECAGILVNDSSDETSASRSGEPPDRRVPLMKPEQAAAFAKALRTVCVATMRGFGKAAKFWPRCGEGLRNGDRPTIKQNLQKILGVAEAGRILAATPAQCRRGIRTKEG